MATTDRLAGEAEWMGRLLDAFGGDPTGWEWTGEVREQDPSSPAGVRCACGQHGLRFLFPWRRPGQDGEVITGSVCVDQVPGLSAEQLQRIRSEVERREGEERRAASARRRADGDEEARAMAEEVRRQLERVLALDARYKELAPEQRLLVRDYSGYHDRLVAARKLKTPSGKLARLTPMRDALSQRLAASDAADALRIGPSPAA